MDVAPGVHLGSASIPVIVADVDEDGDADIVYALGHNYGVFWMEQTKENGRRAWKKHLVDDTWSVGHSPLWVDFDNNGKKEFVNGKRYRAHELRDPGALDPQVMYRYEFDTATGKFQRYEIMAKGGPAGSASIRRRSISMRTAISTSWCLDAADSTGSRIC